MIAGLLAVAACTAPLLSGCSSSSSSQPTITQADLSKSLQDGGIKQPALADCFAKMFIDAGISQDGLRLLVKPHDPSASGMPADISGLSQDDQAKLQGASQKAPDCLKVG
ncbi:hypothetical protein EBN03_05575 [Nocardia stercoris]|uniref:Uncharacterized protein n=1 Tax=Nocardia stercoris TaxID=2483361 RepID=A0A3M2LEI6_9NOCA|nr:hypothetical protein EBN03_05575 [Nocardia stercoris]